MAFQNDIVVYDSSGQLVLVVDVRMRRGTTSDWAMILRRNLLGQGMPANVPYFLLALPDRFYLWVNKPQIELLLPDYVVDPLPLLKPYLGTEEVSEYLSEIGFEMVVESWISTLTWANELPAEIAKTAEWLVESGLFEALKNGRLVSEVTL